MTSLVQQIKQLILTDLVYFEKEKNICMDILDFLIESEEEALNRITFFDLFLATKSLSSEEQNFVFKAAQYLTGDRAQLLEVAFEFRHNGLIYPLIIDDVYNARNTGIFKHPITGDDVDDFESKIVLYLVLGKKGKELKQLTN